MRSVAWLRRELQRFPDDARLKAVEGERIGLQVEGSEGQMGWISLPGHLCRGLAFPTETWVPVVSVGELVTPGSRRRPLAWLASVLAERGIVRWGCETFFLGGSGRTPERLVAARRFVGNMYSPEQREAQDFWTRLYDVDRALWEQRRVGE